MSVNAPDAPIAVHGIFSPETDASINIAVAQILPSDQGLQGPGGLPKLEAITRYAAVNKADVVVFPEYFSGATHDAWRAVRQSGPLAASKELDEEHWLSFIARLARENDITIVAGTVVELGTQHAESEHAPLHNTAYCVSRQGKLVGQYTKRNLWHPERETICAGTDQTHNHPVLFELDTRRGLRFVSSMAICWDMAWPETFRRMLKADPECSGPDVVFLPTCWYASDATPRGLQWNKDGEAAMLDALLLTRAIETEAVMVLANIAGPEWPANIHTGSDAATFVQQGEIAGVGRSSVAAPFVGAVDRVDHARETLLLASVDLGLLQDARNVYRIRFDLAQE